MPQPGLRLLGAGHSVREGPLLGMSPARSRRTARWSPRPTREAPRIAVVLALIERRGRLLVCQRRPGPNLGGYWEFPGGKREAGETWEACVRREMREELGVTVRAIREWDRFSYRYPEQRVRFRVFRCALGAEAPRPLAAQRLRWVSAARLKRYRFPPANRVVIERLTRRCPSRRAVV